MSRCYFFKFLTLGSLHILRGTTSNNNDYRVFTAKITMNSILLNLCYFCFLKRIFIHCDPSISDLDQKSPMLKILHCKYLVCKIHRYLSAFKIWQHSLFTPTFIHLWLITSFFLLFLYFFNSLIYCKMSLVQYKQQIFICHFCNRFSRWE